MTFMRTSRVPWNFGGGRAHLVIVHDGSDFRFGALALKGCAECRQVQVAVDAAELLAA
ncbi:hypothetical protein MycrhN_3078 [Mycolicibacterium rhodesiae NBB3]|uniref:Uncharacterized protein n=1 Tax=Mycolicibacterium rhodesiae (strain NBB3) TaxID=710685 RepID=G8RLI4_MYCRN|nr:hypothetical protein MycrhN_3078 [Mycolicibacterium rhodesiae NBB3]